MFRSHGIFSKKLLRCWPGTGGSGCLVVLPFLRKVKKIVLGPAPLDHRAQQHGGQFRGGTARVQGPVGSANSSFLAAGGYRLPVDCPDHPAGGLSPLPGRLPVSNRPVS